ncbi:hypothetical protein DOTSEDRAFT_86674 [Dothistroma septosporum NZE10]|uniref:Uncharacterized protein n=1 Tax=Dothistroma septosporum (strain NZE10 / CBS 128990) TaxID=675120 RepID=N1PRJ4_DOTSN|nr:hypothetical protein DOTSEDRAFT_86674 [Dothistroma septosporum NZE10]
MSSFQTRAPGVFKQAYYKWRALRLPWRKQWLCGADLAGNTFWEFKDALNANRLRRIVRYTRAGHYADIKISPQWSQWLKHTRKDPPSIEEQKYDVARQARMKQLAAEADERWKSIPSYLDAPNKQQPAPATELKDPGGYAEQTEPEEQQGVMNVVEHPDKVAKSSEGQDLDEGKFKGRTKEKKPKENPWQKASRGKPGEDWQPESWSPAPAARRGG